MTGLGMDTLPQAPTLEYARARCFMPVLPLDAHGQQGARYHCPILPRRRLRPSEAKSFGQTHPASSFPSSLPYRPPGGSCGKSRRTRKGRGSCPGCCHGNNSILHLPLMVFKCLFFSPQNPTFSMTVLEAKSWNSSCFLSLCVLFNQSSPTRPCGLTGEDLVPGGRKEVQTKSSPDELTLPFLKQF